MTLFVIIVQRQKRDHSYKNLLTSLNLFNACDEKRETETSKKKPKMINGHEGMDSTQSEKRLADKKMI